MMVSAIPSIQDIGAGLTLVANGACDLASSTVQQFVANPSIAQAGLHVLAAQIEVLEHLVAKLRFVALGIQEVQTNLSATRQMEWHSPAGQAFRSAVEQRQAHAAQLTQLIGDIARLAKHSIDDLRAQIAALQTLLVAARAAMGDMATAAIGQVCS